MNNLVIVVTSNIKNENDLKRLFQSIDISNNIYIYFINQSVNKRLEDFYNFSKCKTIEIVIGKTIPLSTARNLGLKKIYKENKFSDNTLVLFTDDDAWFPKETLDYLFNCKSTAYALKTIDPFLNKSFNPVNNKNVYITGWHVIKDICSICMVIPLSELLKHKILFNEKLGLGNKISQGEESLFLYQLYNYGMQISNLNYFVYHPYKVSRNLNNYYSMSYFWSLGLFHISNIFAVPALKYLFKYTVALGLFLKDIKYIKIFTLVWKGFFDGMADKYRILGDKNE